MTDTDNEDSNQLFDFYSSLITSLNNGDEAQTQNSDTSHNIDDSLSSINGMLEYSLGRSLTSNAHQSQATSNQNSGSASAQTQNSDTQVIQSSNVEESLNSISGMMGKSLGQSLTSNSQQSQATSNQNSGSVAENSNVQA